LCQHRNFAIYDIQIYEARAEREASARYKDGSSGGAASSCECLHGLWRRTALSGTAMHSL